MGERPPARIVPPGAVVLRKKGEDLVLVGVVAQDELDPAPAPDVEAGGRRELPHKRRPRAARGGGSSRSDGRDPAAPPAGGGGDDGSPYRPTAPRHAHQGNAWPFPLAVLVLSLAVTGVLIWRGCWGP